MTRSIPYCTTSAFSSTVMNDEWRTKNHCSLTPVNWTNSFITSEQTEYKSPRVTDPLLFWFSVFILCHGKVLTKPLPSNGLRLWLHYSGFQASYHNVKLTTGFLEVCSHVYIYMNLLQTSNTTIFSRYNHRTCFEPFTWTYEYFQCCESELEEDYVRFTYAFVRI
jgi:hypothetical protein